MTRAVLVDTGPLYAAVDPDDSYHAQAQRELAALERDKLTVVLAYPILLEAFALILYWLERHATDAWMEDVLAGSALVNPTPQDYREAAATVGQYPDQAITLFDATLATLALRLNMPVWTYDHHFDVMQATVWR